MIKDKPVIRFWNTVEQKLEAIEMSREIEIEIEVDFFKGIENPDDQTGDKSRIAHDAIANHSRYFKTS